jgi:hypothetical protein
LRERKSSRRMKWKGLKRCKTKIRWKMRNRTRSKSMKILTRMTPFALNHRLRIETGKDRGKVQL